jgi:hypothetical protein
MMLLLHHIEVITCRVNALLIVVAGGTENDFSQKEENAASETTCFFQ